MFMDNKFNDALKKYASQCLEIISVFCKEEIIYVLCK